MDKLIQVSADQMQAMLYLTPPFPGYPRLDLKTLEDILDEEGIKFGRLPNVIHQCLDTPPGMLSVRSAVIALGTLPVKGKDAWLRFTMEVGPLPGKVMGNGEIDFRERNMFVGVDKNQVIAIRVPPTVGMPGRDLFGNTVAQTPGRDITIKVTDDAVFDPATGEIRAGRAGVLSMVSEHSVKVCSRQVIATDVDFTTGNLISRNALEIKGSVKPKFKVNALGDILIHGNVEKSQIRSDSNVVVRSGMLGEQAAIRARGEVDIPFIEHGSIIADGSITVRKNAYYCRLHTNTDIYCDPSSRIIASQLVSGGSITAGNVGSNNADPSLLAAAVFPQQWQQYLELQRIIAHQEYQEKRLRMKIGPRVDSEQLAYLADELQENKRQLARLNLIRPETMPATDTGLAHALTCRITIKGMVFAGTEIRIGNSRMILPVAKTNICFCLHNPAANEDTVLSTNNDIILIPLKN
nr:FapA family protein [Desulfobulbus alkaliphilus]